MRTVQTNVRNRSKRPPTAWVPLSASDLDPFTQSTLQNGLPRLLGLQGDIPQTEADHSLKDTFKSRLRVGDGLERVQPDLPRRQVQPHRSGPAPVGEAHYAGLWRDGELARRH